MTEHHHVELKDQDISPATRNRFEVLKKEYPEVFLLNNHVALAVQALSLCMWIREIALPFIKSHIHYLLTITAGFNKKLRQWNMWGSSRKVLVLGPAQSFMVPKQSAPGEPPRQRMCVDFRRINELQPKTQMVDKQTNTLGNLSSLPLPKIDKMYADLRDA